MLNRSLRALVLLLSAVGPTVVSAQFDDVRWNQDSTVVFQPEIWARGSVASGATAVPRISINANLLRLQVPVFKSSFLGLSISAATNLPALPTTQADSTVENLIRFGPLVSVTGMPWIKVSYVHGLDGYLYTRFSQEYYQRTSQSTGEQVRGDLSILRLATPGACFVANAQELFGSTDTSGSGNRLLFLLDVSLPEIRPQNGAMFMEQFPLDGTATRRRYRHIHVGVSNGTVTTTLEYQNNAQFTIWTAGVSIKLL